MKIIYLHHPYEISQIPHEDVVLAMGFFDGVHRGHQAVLKAGRAVANEKKIPLAAMTFNQHPASLYRGFAPSELSYLTLLPEKIDLMRLNSVDLLYIVDYTPEFGYLKPQTFVNQYMVDLHAKVLVAGFDYTYGPKDIADMAHLADYAQGRFEIINVPKLSVAEQKIGSSEIKQLLLAGELAAASGLLGYPYQTFGEVVHGEARGRTLGFPTANIQSQLGEAMPGPGVYAVKIKVANQWYLGMAQIGYNITFGEDNQLTVEVYILDFVGDIYGQVVAVQWWQRLRTELKYTGVEPLIEQLHADEQATRDYFVQLEEK